MSSSTTECGIGIRGVAMTIDAVIWFFPLFFIAVYAIALPTGEIETTASGLDANLTGTLGQLSFGLWVTLGIGYHTLCEYRWGKTLGKHLVSIKAVSGDGTPLTGREAVVRNVLRIVDFLPICYIVGIVVILVSDRPHRLGDRVADTTVIRP